MLGRPLTLTLIATAAMAADPPRRLPVFAGNGATFVMVDTDGSVKAWGRTGRMSLGDGIVQPNLLAGAPQPVAGIQNAMSAAVGGNQALVLLADGRVMAWGDNLECEVGNGDPNRKPRRGDTPPATLKPVLLAGLRDVKQVAAAEHVSGAVLKDGTVKLWGTHDRDLLADGSPDRPTCVAVPQTVEGLTGVRQLSLAADHGLALLEDGSVMAWGRNDRGQAGDGTRDARTRPVKVQGLSNAVSVAATHNASGAVLADGTVRTWGDNINGLIGDPTSAGNDFLKRLHLTPYAVPGIKGAKSILAGYGLMIVHLADGTLRGWGEGYHGGLGNGSLDAWFPTPQTPKGLGPIAAHYIAGKRSIGVRADGSVLVWGPVYMDLPSGRQERVAVPALAFPAR